MLFNKIKLVAQVIGFACIGLLAVYGAVVAAPGGPPAWASGNLSSSMTPAYVSYQGTLRDADDNPANGTYNMVVKIYDNAGATGTPLWQETHNGVEVREGHFNLLLGESNPISPDIFTSPDRYIQLTVDGTAMVPTQRFASVPYAIAATYATTLSAPDGDPAEAVTVNNAGRVGIGTTSPDDRALTIQGTGAASEWISFKDNTGTTQWHLNYSQVGLNFVESGVAEGRLFLEDGGDVGIGTTDPQAKLDVDGSARVSNKVGVGTDPDPSGSRLHVSGPDNDYTKAALKITSGSQHMLLDGNEIDVMDNGTLWLNGNGTGKVAVGNDLDVGGNINWSGHLGSMSDSGLYGLESDGEGHKYLDMESVSNNICWLATVKFREDEGGKQTWVCEVIKSGGYWQLHVYAEPDSDDGGYTYCRARCLRW